MSLDPLEDSLLSFDTVCSELLDTSVLPVPQPDRASNNTRVKTDKTFIIRNYSS